MFGKKITFFCISVLAVFLYCCFDDFSSSLDPDNLSDEDEAWLEDSDSNGIADSIQFYAAGCELPVEECLAIARKERDRRVDSLTLLPPVFSFPTGTYERVIYVEISTREDAIIRYTVDGREPDQNAMPYTTPIKVEISMVIKAKAFNPNLYTSEAAEAEYIISIREKLPAPGFSASSGTYGSVFDLVLTPPSTGASIYYTTDGKAPTAASYEYSAPLSISRSMVVRAVALKQGFLQSEPDSGVYELKPGVPAASPPGGSYDSVIQVELISDVPGSVIRYTEDNSDPTESSEIYKGLLTIAVNATLKARVFMPGWTVSELMTEEYAISISGTANGAVFHPPGGTYSRAREVIITSSTESADIRYTIDGKIPDSSSFAYIGPITVDANTVIKARAYKDSLLPSAVAEASYRLRPDPPVISPPSGTYDTEIEMVITPPPLTGVTVRYSVNGADPDSTSHAYSGPVAVNSSRTVRARAFKTGWDPSETDTAIYAISIPGMAAAPEFLPQGGEFTGPTAVSMSSATPGAFIYYDFDGNSPTDSSPLYTAPIILNQSRIIKAMAVKAGMQNSNVSTAEYSIRISNAAAAPEFTPGAGSYDDSVSVTINSSTAGALIYYTTDGNSPTTGSMLYAGPVSIKQTALLSALAVKSGMENSGVSTAIYTIQASDTVYAPEFLPGAGSFNDSVSVTISSATSGALIYYSTDSTVPTTASILYQGPVRLKQTTLLSAVAVKTGMVSSRFSAAVYEVIPRVITVGFSVPGGPVPLGTRLALFTEEPGSIIRYTLNGAAPTDTSAIFRSGDSIIISRSMTVTAGIWVGGGLVSELSAKSYSISTQISDSTAFTLSGAYSFTVPSGVDKIRVKLWGAGGGTMAAEPWGTGMGGKGGYVEALVPVHAGDTYVVIVGGGGQTTNCGGGTNGGGGGGFSGIFDVNYKVIAAAGGGGGGHKGNMPCNGGGSCQSNVVDNGGEGFGGGGTRSGAADPDGEPGKGAPDFSGGHGGIAGGGSCSSYGDGGFGGGGGGGSTSSGFGGGGGGGGFPGGGGGIKGMAGAGGANVINISATSVANNSGGAPGGTSDADGEDGRVVILVSP